jgi:hypothetical protein
MPGGDGVFLTRQRRFVEQLFIRWAGSPEAKLWLRGADVFALHDFSTQVANQFEFLPCSTSQDCQALGLNLECNNGLCVGGSCNVASNDDTQCNPLHPNGFRFVCCNSTEKCGSLHGKCVLESDCDTIVSSPSQAECPNGANSSCASGQVCSSGHRCVWAGDRAFLCGLGLRNHDGSAKEAWNYFFLHSYWFSSRAWCECPNNIFPCDSDCPTNQGAEQECIRWENDVFGVCFPK